MGRRNPKSWRGGCGKIGEDYAMAECTHLDQIEILELPGAIAGCAE